MKPTDTQDLTAPEAVELWHEEIHGMKSGSALFEGQQEYVRYEDYATLSAALDRATLRATVAERRVRQERQRGDILSARAEASEAERDALKAELADARRLGATMSGFISGDSTERGVHAAHKFRAFIARHQKDTGA